VKSVRWLSLVTAGLFITSIAAFIMPAEGAAWAWQCPIHSLTGWSCPGCGGTRAIHALLHGDLASALKLNALAVLVFVAGVVYVATAWLGRLESKWFAAPDFSGRFTYVTLAAVVIFTLVRNL